VPSACAARASAAISTAGSSIILQRHPGWLLVGVIIGADAMEASQKLPILLLLVSDNVCMYVRA
jgi:hypothetical protein